MKTKSLRSKKLRREESFFGLHFDFHAQDDCRDIGKNTTYEMVEKIIEKADPDYIQCDCKGHRGLSSYPTKVGNPAPGVVTDGLKVWREVTEQFNVALFLHYSGVQDFEAVARHPEWACLNADGTPDDKATSIFGDYSDQLLIPQLKELAGEYGADGVWLDGECWGECRDYSERALQKFTEKT